MRRRKGFVILGLATAMLASGCASSTSSSDTGGSGALRVALMGISSGPNYVKGRDNPFKLAVDEINAAGGISGRKIEYKEFDTDITPQGAVNATNLAIQYKPNVIIGYSVSAGLKASIGALNAYGAPVIHSTLASLTSPDSLGSKLTFRLEPTTAQFTAAADQYLFQDKGVKSMMVINTQDSAPTEGAKQIQDDAAKNGVSTTHRAVSPTVTDLTEPIVAAKGKDAIWAWGYATTDALAVKTAASNGFTGDIMTFSAGTAAGNGLIPSSLLTDKVTSVGQCAPYALDTPEAKKYVAAYTAKYGVPPNDSVVSQQYDALYMFKAAVEKAGSTEAKKVADALAQADYAGACGQEKTDANHNMLHSVPILKFTGGKPTLVKMQSNLDSPY